MPTELHVYFTIHSVPVQSLRLKMHGCAKKNASLATSHTHMGLVMCSWKKCVGVFVWAAYADVVPVRLHLCLVQFDCSRSVEGRLADQVIVRAHVVNVVHSITIIVRLTRIPPTISCTHAYTEVKLEGDVWWITSYLVL